MKFLDIMPSCRPPGVVAGLVAEAEPGGDLDVGILLEALVRAGEVVGLGLRAHALGRGSVVVLQPNSVNQIGFVSPCASIVARTSR